MDFNCTPKNIQTTIWLLKNLVSSSNVRKSNQLKKYKVFLAFKLLIGIESLTWQLEKILILMD